MMASSVQWLLHTHVDTCLGDRHAARRTEDDERNFAATHCERLIAFGHAEQLLSNAQHRASQLGVIAY